MWRTGINVARKNVLVKLGCTSQMGSEMRAHCRVVAFLLALDSFGVRGLACFFFFF